MRMRPRVAESLPMKPALGCYRRYASVARKFAQQVTQGQSLRGIATPLFRQAYVLIKAPSYVAQNNVVVTVNVSMMRVENGVVTRAVTKESYSL